MTDSEKPAERTEPDEAVAPAAATEPDAELDHSAVRSVAPTLASGYWVSVVVGLLVLLVLLVFILENGQTARVAFFGVHGHLPQGVALLFAAVIGGLFVVLAGAARILQLRIRLRGRPTPRRVVRRRKRAEPQAESRRSRGPVTESAPHD
jgi:uncharacterized integral membrane protein